MCYLCLFTVLCYLYRNNWWN